jgi:hypothetical protein
MKSRWRFKPAMLLRGKSKVVADAFAFNQIMAVCGRQSDSWTGKRCDWDPCGAHNPLYRVAASSRMKEYGIARMKNGPALAGNGAAETGNEIATSTKNWLPQLRKSLTWDQGAEMAKHSKLQVDMALRIYFCEPLSP